MKRFRNVPVALMGACIACASPAVLAADYSLAGGAVKFSAPDAWPMIMEKEDGPRQFVVLQVKNPSPGGNETLARIAVTVERVDDLQAFQQFLNDNMARARKLPGYQVDHSQAVASSLRYAATENNHKNTYVEHYAYRDHQGIQVRCVRPADATGSWSATFDAGCKAITTEVTR
jgi:hypothetical protein